ncbi:hypothetical protein BaRGS_00014089 [Batillaria attramentaria]|uniref:Calmodulin n=1 Tax=Batillaria attramentaria TaxID=370345 RepID=A0ABD0L600_9CAEN
MGNVASCRKNRGSPRKMFGKSKPEISPVLAKIRAAQQRHLDEIIESKVSDSDSESQSDLDSDNEDDVLAVDEADSPAVWGRPTSTSSSHMDSLIEQVDKKAHNADPRDYDYPFENVVLEGGGNKGIAYCGAIRVLEELGIWERVKRLAGASAGAMTAALLAVGYDSYQLEEFLSQDLSEVFLDHKCGYCSLLPNIITGFGWNPGNRIFRWFGEKLQERCGNADITFREVLEHHKRELCVVVTNLNQMSTEYCHPKTTPDMPVRVAVRMSMAIPGLFRATKYTDHGQTDVFVDGGVLCNYPIHCFDGWWLSMKPEDSFLRRLQPLDHLPQLLAKGERFGKFNEQTLGFLLFADNERELLRYQVDNMRRGTELQELPNTKLAKEKLRKRRIQDKTDREHRRVVRAVNTFLKVLQKHNLDGNHTISRSELEAALEDEEFSRKRRLRLFGDVDSETILQYLDRDGNGQISYQELLHFMEETGINVQARFQGYQRREVKNFSTFLDTLQSTLLTNVKKIFVEERDIQRTVGINTGHVDTSDFVLEPDDRTFLVERGRNACMAFLKYYAAFKNLEKKPARNGDVSASAATDDVTGHTTSNDASGLTAGNAPVAKTPVVSENVGEGDNGRLKSVGADSVIPFLDEQKEGTDADGAEAIEMTTTDEKSPLIPFLDEQKEGTDADGGEAIEMTTTDEKSPCK